MILTYYTLIFPIFLEKQIEVILIYNSVLHEYPLFLKRGFTLAVFNLSGKVPDSKEVL
jgi:hypothetical protein